MSFKINSLYLTDGYKVGHKEMLAPGTTKLYGTWIPRSTKHAPKDITKIVSFGQQLTWKWIHDEFEENFFMRNQRNMTEPEDIFVLKTKSMNLIKDMSLYLGMEYDGKHFEELWDLGYLPIKVKSLPEGIETDPNIPHMTFVNTVDGFAWLPLYLETIISSLSWQASTSATLALQYRRTVEKYVNKTDPKNSFLIPYLCHDFSARGMDPFSMISSGLGHATCFRGSDTLAVIPAARYFYNEPEDNVCINSVNASEHSVSTTKIFTVGEQQMISDWLKLFPEGILSIVSDTFDLWKLITEYLPVNKEDIMNRNGKLVIRPDSGDPVDIICGHYLPNKEVKDSLIERADNIEGLSSAPIKGVIELLWDIFGGTINEQGYKVLDPHIGAIYGDSITSDRQVQIYERLANKGFAATNIVLGIGSFTYQYNTKGTLGFAAKDSWFETLIVSKYQEDNISYGEPSEYVRKSYNIYKDPATDNGTKKSLKGKLSVRENLVENKLVVVQECSEEDEEIGLLKVIYENGKFYNQKSLTEIREKILNLVNYKTNNSFIFKKYQKIQEAELRAYIEGEVLSDKVSISVADAQNGSPKLGDMIARNPKNHNDMWLIAENYFKDSYIEK